MHLFLHFATYSRELHLFLPGSKSKIYGKKYMLIIYNLLFGRNKNLLTFPHICAILMPEFFGKSLYGYSAPFKKALIQNILRIVPRFSGTEYRTGLAIT